MTRRQQRILITYGSITLLTLTGTFVRHFGVPYHLSPTGNLLLTFSSFFYLVFIWEGNRFLHQYLNKIYPFERNTAVRIILQLVIAGTFLVSMRFAVINIMYDYIPSFVKEDSIVLQVVYFADFIFAACIHLSYISNYFFTQWKVSLKKAERLEKEKTQVQFDNLKNQVNPHFLFNNLTLLDGLIHEDPDMASKFLQHLSKVYRYVLQNKEKELVTLEMENNFIHHYISLLQMRFENSLRINRRFDEESLDRRIVPVTLQIMIENAIKHNSATPEQPLTIDLIAQNGWLEVRNNLQRKSQVEHSNGQGLDNLRALYHYLSPRPVEVADTGESFSVKIPLLEQ